MDGSLDGLVFFVGAGASSAGGLPTFPQLRRALLDQVQLDGLVPGDRIAGVLAHAERLAPEVFLSCLGGTSRARSTWLTTVLCQAQRA